MKSFSHLFLSISIFILAPILFFSCGNKSDPSSPANNAPEVSFATWDYEVRSAEISEANQNYSESGSTSYTRPIYTGDGAPAYKIFYSVLESSGYRWFIDETYSDSIGSLSEIIYFIEDTNKFPPSDGWLDSSSNSSVLQITEVPISGDVSTTGKTLTAKYEFIDPDGDSEGVSLYQWYRCDSESDEGTAISGADELEYTTDSDDNLKYLKIEVIPVDEHGLEGSPVKSEASRQIGST